MINENWKKIIIDKWCSFNSAVIKKAERIYVCGLENVFLEAAENLAALMNAELITSEEMSECDAAVMPLRKFSQMPEEALKCRILITFGCDSLDFDILRKKADGIKWINYYAFPYTACVSYGKEMTVQGQKGVYHQLKPIVGTSLAVLNSGGSGQPVNVTGNLAQNINGTQNITFIKAVALSDKTVIACGFDEGILYKAGEFINTCDIYEILVSEGGLKDVAADNEVIYYTQLGELNPFEVKSLLKGSIGMPAEDFEYIEVPYIPKKSDGKADFEKLRKLTSAVLAGKKEIKARIKDKELYVSAEYKNNTVSAFEKGMQVKSDSFEESLSVSDEPALLEMPHIDYSKRMFDGLSQMLKARSVSEQKIRYLNSDGHSEQTYSQLYEESRKSACGLLKKGVKEGDAVILQIADNRKYLTSFWACILMGAIPAPLGVIDDYGSKNINTEKLVNICALLDSYYVLASDEVAKNLGKMIPKENVIVYDDICGQEGIDFEDHIWKDEDVCILLFTSGSTGIPKGVTLTQGNMFARTLSELEKYDITEKDVDLNWMTLTHAAGIIWTHIRDLYLNMFQVQTASEVILQDPLRLLEYLSKYKATLTWTPNFEFTLIRDNYDESKDYGWDLSHVKYVYCTAEANVARDLRGFMEIGAKYGLKDDTVVPCFGMTETSSVMIYYDDFRMNNTSDEDRFVPIGCPDNGHSVRITDESGKILKKGQIGKIEVKGDAVTPGYYKNPAVNAESFTEDGFFITGDMGYIQDNAIILTGRSKEIIIINGLNYYVQDIESVVNEMNIVIPSYTTAVAVENNMGRDEILVVCTPEDPGVFDSDETIRSFAGQVRGEILEKTGLYAKYIIPDLRTKSIRTELGKKQRGKYQIYFEQGKYDEMLKRTGVIKDTGYVMEDFWVPEQHKGRIHEYNAVQSDSYDGLVRLNDDNYVDIFALNASDLNLKDFLEEFYSRCRIWNTCPNGTRISVPSVYGFSVGEEDELNKNSAVLFGLIQSFQQENPNLHMKQIDIDVYDEDTVYSEAVNKDSDTVVVYRNRKRLVREFRTASKSSDYSVQDDLKDRNILVVGGAGGVGRILCRHLIKKYNASLLVTGRNETADIPKKYSDKITYMKADAMNKNELLAAVNKYENEKGVKISVIINLAGVMGHSRNGGYFDDVSVHYAVNENVSDAYTTVSSKVETSIVLKDIADECGIGTYIIFGSVNGILGGTGLSAYAAANGFINEYAKYLRSHNLHAYCINWSGWYGTGISENISDTMISLSQHSGFRFANADENLEYFDAIIEKGIPCAIVGMDRDNKRIRSSANDDYKAFIDVYYTGEGRSLKDMLEDMAVPLRYISVESISYNTDDPEDVNLRDMKRNTLEISSNETELTADQKKMIDIWKSVLHLNRIGLDDDFFGLGGNSLLGIKLVYEVEEAFNVSLNMQNILTKGTVRHLVEEIRGQSNMDPELPYKDQELKFDIDTLLSNASDEAGNTVFITGIDGIIGKFVYKKFKALHPDTEVYCFSKSESSDGRELPNTNILRGNLAEKYFGLPESVYEELSRKAGSVFYCPEDTNFMAEYASVRNETVIPTGNVLEFCCYNTKKTLNYISSSAIFKMLDGKETPVVTEKTEIIIPKENSQTYHAAKAVSEILIEKAVQKGLAARIFRAGSIMGSTEDGTVPEDNFFWVMMKLVIGLKKLPDISVFDYVFEPIDILAADALGLSEIKYDENDHIYHLSSDKISLQEVESWLSGRFGDVETVSLEDWMNEVKRYCEKTDNPLLASLMGSYIKTEDFQYTAPHISSEHTDRVLKAAGLPVLEDVQSVFDKTYEYLKDKSYFEAKGAMK